MRLTRLINCSCCLTVILEESTHPGAWGQLWLLDMLCHELSCLVERKHIPNFMKVSPDIWGAFLGVWVGIVLSNIVGEEFPFLGLRFLSTKLAFMVMLLTTLASLLTSTFRKQCSNWLLRFLEFLPHVYLFPFIVDVISPVWGFYSLYITSKFFSHYW